MANEIGDLEYVGRMNPQRLTSLEEDSKTEQAQILADQKRFAKYGTNSAKLAALMELKQVMPASELVKIRSDEIKRAAEFEAAVQSEQSHNRTRIARSNVDDVVTYTREPIDE